MYIPIRTQLVPLPDSILSSYPIGALERSKLVPVRKFGNDAHCMPHDVVLAVVALDKRVSNAGGDLRITDARRSVATQEAARKKYVNWLNAGKPSRSSSSWDSATMKNAFVAKPGYSFHNAGRSLDIHIVEKGRSIVFPDDHPSQQLDLLWPHVRAVGGRPIIKSPDEQASEAWHFDFLGCWGPTYDRLGYKDGAMCAALDIGVSCYGRDFDRLIQAQLHRAGYDVGEVDGWPGNKTKTGLSELGLTLEQVRDDIQPLFDLPDQSCLLWAA
jgi:hypothetical protein